MATGFLSLQRQEIAKSIVGCGGKRVGKNAKDDASAKILYLRT